MQLINTLIVMEEIITRIIKRIVDKKLLVIIGPGLLGKENESLNNGLYQHLTKDCGKKVNFYAGEELFSMDKRARLLNEDDIKSFYAGLQPNDLFEKIAEIPFPMLISTSPDMLLNRAFRQAKYSLRFRLLSQI